MGGALSAPCSTVNLDKVEEPSPISSYPGGGSSSNTLSPPSLKPRSLSSKVDHRIEKDFSALEVAQKKHTHSSPFIDEKQSIRKSTDSTGFANGRRPPSISLENSNDSPNSVSNNSDLSKSIELLTITSPSNQDGRTSPFPSSVYNIQIVPSPSNKSSTSITFSQSTSSSSNANEPQQPIPSQSMPVMRSPRGRHLEGMTFKSTEDPPTLQPIAQRKFQSPTNQSAPQPFFNSPQTPPSTKTPGSTRNRPHYLSKLSSPPTRVSSPNPLLPLQLSGLRVSKDVKSSSDTNLSHDWSSSITDTNESSSFSPISSTKKSLSLSDGTHSMKNRSSPSFQTSQNITSIKAQIQESLLKFNESIGTTPVNTEQKIVTKRRHSVFASGRNSPSLLNELKQNQKADSTASPSTIFNPNFAFGKTNSVERLQQERRFSEIVSPISKKKLKNKTKSSTNNSKQGSKNKLRMSVEPNSSLTPTRNAPRRRMSISVSPQHKVEMTTTAQVGRDQHGRKIINQYTIIKKLGKGSYGSVKLGKNEQNGNLAAIKVINRSLLNNIKKKWSAPGQQQSSQISKIKLEIAILKNLDHPNIVRLLEVIDDPMNDKICLVFEYIDGGELMKLNDDGILEPGQKPFTEDEARYYFRQILNSLEYLHFNRVVHRDIKPSNILLTKGRDIKLSDFGVSKLLEENEEDTLDDSQGTPAFLPPEACYKGKIQGKPADIWALGITLYCMVVGMVPFRSDEAGASKLLYLYYIIQHEEPNIPDTLSPELKDIISKMLDKNAKTRITMDELQEHPWVTKDEEETFIDDPTPPFVMPTASSLYPDISDSSISYFETRRKSAIPSNRTYVHHAQLRKMHSTRKVVVDSQDIDNAIVEKEYDPNTPTKKASLKKLTEISTEPPKISLMRNRSSCKIMVNPPMESLPLLVPTIEINSKTE